MPQFIIFLLLAMLLMGIVFSIFYLYAKNTTKAQKGLQDEFYHLSERFFELIFSGGSIIGFMAAYYLINRFVTEGSFKEFWDNYKDYLLLVFMVISILVNTFFDHVVIRVKHLDEDAMASIRLTGMLYMIIIFAYIKFVYEDNNYDMFIAYFLTLMIGRFVYFDASFFDFLKCIKRAAANIPMMFMALAYLGIMCLYGYSTEYLLKHNGVITNIFFTHLFIIVAMFVTHFIAYSIVGKKVSMRDDNNDSPKEKRSSKKSTADSREARRIAREERAARRNVRYGKRASRDFSESFDVPNLSETPVNNRNQRKDIKPKYRGKDVEKIDIQDFSDL